MCGLVGMAGDLNHKDKKVMENLLILSSFRGKDSTGVALVDNTNQEKVKVIKTVGDPYCFLDYRPWDLASSYNQKVMIGHTRHTTVGKINKTNAHPFTEEHITGVHNGTLSHGWKQALADGTYFDVDSQAIMHNLSLDAADVVIPKLVGAYALVWWDENESTLNFIRNDKRPLYFCQTKDKRKMFWASEIWMLNMLRSSHGDNVDLYTDKDNYAFFSLPVDTHRVVKVEGKGATPLKVISEKKLKGGEKPPVTSAGGTGSTNNNRWKDGSGGHYVNGMWRPHRYDDTRSTRRNVNNGGSKTSTEKKPKTNVVLLPEVDDLPFSQSQEIKDPFKEDTTTTSTSGKSLKSGVSKTTLSKRDSKAQTSSLSLVSNNKGKCCGNSTSTPNPSLVIKNNTGEEISFVAFKQITSGGFCTYCQNQLADLPEAANGIAKWIDSESFLCNACTDVQDYYESIYG